MPADAMQRASLAYRRAHDAIWQGNPPDKYTRLVPYCQGGGRALEIGSAEGVLSLLLARERAVDSIIGLELRAGRHGEARRLQARWAELGEDVSRCTLLQGNILERLDLLEGRDLLLAVRSLYYLRGQAVDVIQAAYEAGVRRIVLCGNRGRQARHRANPFDELGEFNRLAAIEGMTDVLYCTGYVVAVIIEQGDPIVVGHHPRRA